MFNHVIKVTGDGTSPLLRNAQNIAKEILLAHPSADAVVFEEPGLKHTLPRSRVDIGREAIDRVKEPIDDAA